MATGKSAPENTKPAPLAIPDVTDDMLRSVASLDDAVRLVTELYGAAPESAADHLGNGFAVVEEKDHLLNRPLLIIATKQHTGDWGTFSSVFGMMMDTQERVIFNDGSTGVHANIGELIERTGRIGGWIVKNGLRKSEYPTCTNCGRPRGTVEEECAVCKDKTDKRGKGCTYYLDAA